MAKRLTVEVAALLDAVNFKLRNSTCPAADRWGMISVLESVLHGTGQYHGFSFLSAKEVPAGQLPGIIFDNSPEHKHVFPDETRRQYGGSIKAKRPL